MKRKISIYFTYKLLHNEGDRKMDKKIKERLLDCFPGSYFSKDKYVEEKLVLNKKNNIYCPLTKCKTELDVKCKVLEWLPSIGCYRMAFRSPKKSEKFRNSVLAGINKFLGTNFTRKEFVMIHCSLGYASDSYYTREFIESGYNLKILN